MTLNIKNPEAHRLARELTALTGESITRAVTEAVRERLARVRQAPLGAHLLAIGKDCAAHLKGPSRSIDHANLLYGADGCRRDRP
jgi:antitoxin VapB